MSSDDKYQRALDAVNALFSDTSVPASDTRASLETLQGEIDVMLESLPKDD